MVADSLAPETVERHLGGRFGRPYLYQERCESTQLLFDENSPEGALAVCDEQTAGRGRLGRSWVAPPGTSILCSVLLRPPARRPVAELSLVGGVATADMLERALELAVQIKWPNDIMLRRSKVAGLLAEAREASVVLGIGINVNQEREELPEGAGSLRTLTGRTWERAPLLGFLLADLALAYDEWVADGLDALYDRLGARDFLRGRRVTVNGTRGTAVMIARDGRLEIRTEDGELRKVESGEVLYER